jgi:hypothetical protein
VWAASISKMRCAQRASEKRHGGLAIRYGGSGGKGTWTIPKKLVPLASVLLRFLLARDSKLSASWTRRDHTMRSSILLLLAAQAAWAAEVCVSKKGELLTTDYVVQPIDAPDKSQRCYALTQPSMQELLQDEAFWTREHLDAWARSRPWYVYLLTAWVLSAVTTLLK